MSHEKRLITPEDVYRITLVEDPRLSPDGRWVAFVRVTTDRMENGYKRTIWLVEIASGETRQLTRSGKDSSPRWSPDGSHLAFVSSREGKPQIYLLPVRTPGGEPRALTAAANGASSPAWSSDGAWIAYLAATHAEERAQEDRGETPEPPKDKLEGKHRSERRDEDEKKRLDPYPMQRIPYRAGTSFLGDRHSQVTIIAVAEGLEGDAARPRRLTSAPANHEAPRWSADGQFIFTARQMDPNSDEPFRHSAVYRVSVADGALTQLTTADYTSYSPLPSPDGRWVAYGRLLQTKGMYEQIDRLTVMPADGGEGTELTLALDQSVTDYAWSQDSSAIVLAGASRGETPLYRIAVPDGTVETLCTGAWQIQQMDVAADSGVVFTASRPTAPVELFYLAPNTTQPQQMTHFNQKWLDEVSIHETHEVRFTNAEGVEIQGWYLLPAGYEEGIKYPLVLNIHGGPHVMWGPSMPSMFLEWQHHAASGYVVFYCNPRGSDGYGQAFRQALHAAWGQVAYLDVMAGVDAMLAKGFVDETRMAITGGSYGGYLTTWILGHTQRFAAAVSQRGVYNLLSFYGTSDVPSLISGEFDIDPWENPSWLWEQSPLAHAHHIKTPLLLEHGENDFRVPVEQGEQMFAYVRRSGGTVEMLRYPREGHEMSRSGEPEHRIIRLRRMVEWFDRYCK